MAEPMTLLPTGIQKMPIEKWVNAHQNFTHTFKKNASFKLTLPEGASNTEKYKATTNNFKWLIRYGIENGISLRAIGSGWSFSQVAICDGGLVDTKSLTLSFILKDSFVAQEYRDKGNKASDLFFAQCGMSVLRLNEILETELDPKRCLKASGASNGQSIAGCTSTGTHGSGINVGAVHDTIVGLHLVVGPDRHVWIEKKSHPVASPSFLEWLGAEPITDDNIFHAALVSFGSFGFIHGILLETEPIFLLEKHSSKKMAYDSDAVDAIQNLRFRQGSSVLPFPPDAPGKTLYHFEVIVNPHSFETGNAEKGIYFRSIYKVPYRNNYPKIQRDDHGFTYGDNTLGVIQTVIDQLGSNLSAKLVPALVSKLFPLAFTVAEESVGTIGEMFNNTKFRGKAASTAIAVNSSDAGRVLEEIVAINKATPFPGALALRYVKGTAALLGFTQYAKTCIMELDGVDSEITRHFYENIWQRLEELAIPYSLHWGKINTFLNAERVRKMYGEAKVNTWLTSRHQLLDEATRKVFTNPFMDQCGLSD